MSHHVNEPHECPACEEKLEECHYLLAYWFEKLKHEFPDAHISWGFRSKEDQDEAFANHKSRLRWPMSKHNVMVKGKASSRAIDLFRLTDDYQAEFNPQWFKEVFEFLEDNEAPIVWGGSWKTFKDLCHFELKPNA